MTNPAVIASFVVIIGVQLVTSRRRVVSAGSVTNDRGSGRLFGALSVAGIASAWALSRVHVARLPAGPAIVVGLVLMWAGCAFRLWAYRALGRFFDPVVTIHPDHQVIVNGPYRIVRHPVYSGLLITYTGLGVALGSIPTVAACLVPALVALVYRIVVEERALTEGLGAAYTGYSASRRRLIPGIW